MAKLVMFIGIPGSGKSTAAKKYREDHPNFKFANIWEADQFFIDNKTKEYKWDPFKLRQAHEWCQLKVNFDLAREKNTIVSNTNLTPSERRPYIKMAKKNGAEIEVITCNGNFENIHGVPPEVIEKMKKKFVPFSKDELNI